MRNFSRFIVLILVLAGMLFGCSMFRTWQAIPPPGGCDQCHKEPIGNDWQITLVPVTLIDESGRPPWQKEESMLPPQQSPMQEQKITEQRCFRCHKGPDKAHIEYKGRYHH